MNLDRFAQKNDLLMCGLPVRGLTELRPKNSNSIYSEDAFGRPILVPSTVFATVSTDVAIFAAAIWSRDRWSGWHTYKDPDGTIWHEFFAIPSVLKAAVLNPGGSIYLVDRRMFEPYHAIPGEFVLRAGVEAVPVAKEVYVSCYDMETYVYQASEVNRCPKPDRPRPADWASLERYKTRPVIDPRRPGRGPADGYGWRNDFLTTGRVGD